jgi:group II intron reverse transcriptase/maturase
LGNLSTPENVRKLQNSLYAKAKGNPEFRFYALYDKVYRPDILEYAYRCCKSNDGSPGPDGQTFEMIEEQGREKWLGELAVELREKTYKPGAVRRKMIPKGNTGKMRPLGIPNLKDRVAQTSAKIILEAIFEADLQEEQYAYRPGKRATEAVQKIQCLLNRDFHREVVDADLSGYFDTIPHSELMKSIARRVSDKAMLHLVKMWLVAPVEEKDEKSGKILRTTVNRDTKREIPQGAY